MTSKIQITLSSANMGPEATEADFDRWAAYVGEHIEGALSLPEGSVEVDQSRFAGGEAEDVIVGAGSLYSEEVRRWLSVDGWEAFCSQPSGV